MAQLYNKKLTNIEKIKLAKKDSFLIINPPQSFNNLLYERHGLNNYRITAFNPFGYTSKIITKNIGLIELCFLTYYILTPEKQNQGNLLNRITERKKEKSDFEQFKKYQEIHEPQKIYSKSYN